MKGAIPVMGSKEWKLCMASKVIESSGELYIISIAFQCLHLLKPIIRGDHARCLCLLSPGCLLRRFFKEQPLLLEVEREKPVRVVVSCHGEWITVRGGGRS